MALRLLPGLPINSRHCPNVSGRVRRFGQQKKQIMRFPPRWVSIPCLATKSQADRSEPFCDPPRLSEVLVTQRQSELATNLVYDLLARPKLAGSRCIQVAKTM